MSYQGDFANLANIVYIEKLYAQYLSDPNSVEKSWQYFFEGMALGASLKGAPAPDSLISLGVVMGALQLFVMVIRASFIDVEKTTIFASFIAFALSFNAIGKRISTKTIIKNLGLANVPDGINAGYIITDTDAVKRLARSLDEKVPQVLVSRKTGVITNFVNSGFSIHKSDFLARKISIFTYVSRQERQKPPVARRFLSTQQPSFH